MGQREEFCYRGRGESVGESKTSGELIEKDLNTRGPRAT